MPISRRFFLRAGTMVVLGAAANSRFARVASAQKTHGNLSPVNGFGVPAESMNDPLTFFTKSTFAAQLNSKFRLRSENSSSVVVTLVAVNDLAPAPARLKAPLVGGQECFSLIFSGKRLPQGTYTVEHGALGTFKLMLVPAGKQGSVAQMEAVINRLYS
jgi:hypothetical protein